MYIDHIYCPDCGQIREHVNNQCCTCATLRQKQSQDQWMNKSLNEKLLDLLSRIERLEQGPPVF